MNNPSHSFWFTLHHASHLIPFHKYFEYIIELKEMFKSYNLNINSDLVIVRTSEYQYNNKKVMFLFEFIFEYSFRDYFGKLCIESLSKIILSKNDN